ncbi:hypothetical protein, partial [Glutamicibacter arilaitensis]|uniref:hypothetical protein n=1 Tax=Glutamicibacter arilaitensis TaxID=256701 RepID=UPI003FD084EC
MRANIVSARAALMPLDVATATGNFRFFSSVQISIVKLIVFSLRTSVTVLPQDIGNTSTFKV